MERREGWPWTRTAYEEWIEREGIPIHETLGGVADVTELPRQPWARTGGLGTFIQMRGTFEAERGIYVAEIPGGGALNPERHLYEEAIFVLRGRGLTEVWQEGEAKVTFEWGEGSVFAPPLNTWHRLINGTKEPALFMAMTTAPSIMEYLPDTEFIFNSDHRFWDRLGKSAEYFAPGEDRYWRGWSMLWRTNFIPDVREAFLYNHEKKVSGGVSLGYRMAGGFPVGHIAEWPVGRYHKAHYHGAGAVLLGLRGKGYVLLWPREIGIHPYQDGHEEEVVKIDWKPHSIYAPPDGWFHQHFSTGQEPARQVAIYGGRANHSDRPRVEGESAVYSKIRTWEHISVTDGGTLIDYEDEDPDIRKRFEGALREEGVQCTMRPVLPRKDRP